MNRIKKAVGIRYNDIAYINGRSYVVRRRRIGKAVCIADKVCDVDDDSNLISLADKDRLMKLKASLAR